MEMAAVLLMKIIFALKLIFSFQTASLITSQNNFRVQINCFAHSDKAIYSASADDSAIMFWFLVFHEICVLFMYIAYPVVSFLVSLHHPQSASTYAQRDEWERSLKVLYFSPFSVDATR